MDARTFKDRVYGEFARVGKVLSSPKRFELLDLLSQSPKSVETLAQESNMTMANTSKHLQTLLDARLVDYQKNKNYVIYHLASHRVVAVLFSIKSIAEDQIPEINHLREDVIVKGDQLETIALEDWVDLKAEDSHVLIDVRPHTEFSSGHIDGALSIPVGELHEHLKKLPKNKEIIAYCRGPYCVYATQAVEFLKEQGYQAARLEAGFHEWQQYQANHNH
ncbi:metalloregulator ArsR/SmtB family transcription factor [Thalassobacillus devorans]|uniref:metalloregulator ArsR/SmtB family transcription factor n=1 Tax=Thalassobacillus devorans TaxID=279813 RepID=UPI00048EBCF4|nr:metalloregulator ArsR/SmtB family transcription factor [Thalassobacillus devorans]